LRDRAAGKVIEGQQWFALDDRAEKIQPKDVITSIDFPKRLFANGKTILRRLLVNRSGIAILPVGSIRACYSIPGTT
jgi:hypothetical protein